MTNSSARARNADSGSTRNEHRFPWKWNLSDLEKVQKNGKTVFSCFSCGGGSSMGYKLAGYDVIGCCEIDPRVLEVYRKNLHPAHPYLADVRDFLRNLQRDGVPECLRGIDILDGSPPCSSFSTVGEREKGWGKDKVFREGQAKQKLDDLFFWFINVADELKPKVVIAENVSGLIKGNAKGYVNEIFKAFNDAGYDPQLFLLNAAHMGVPQRRERTVFIARRKDLGLPWIQLQFREKPVYFREVRSAEGKPVNPETMDYKLLQLRQPGDHNLGDINRRWKGKETLFGHLIAHDNEVCATITASLRGYRDCDGKMLTEEDIRNVCSFPQDYDFCGQDTTYICGMSVPPVMMAQIATEVYRQWLK